MPMRYRLGVWSVVVGAIVTIFMSFSVMAIDVPPKPPLQRPVVDMSNTLTSKQIDELSAAINQTRQEKDYQIGVLIVPTLENQALEDFSLNVARTWGIGDKTNNGVLLLVVKNDRLIRIEVGTGLEGDLTDAESGRIIRDVITPEFRKGNYQQGIQKGVMSIKAQVERTADPNLAAQAKSNLSIKFFESLMPLFTFGAIILSWFSSLLARSKSWWAGGIVGLGVGLVIAYPLGWTHRGISTIIILAILGLLFDYFVSKNYYYKTTKGNTPSWWAGGDWISGGGGGGGFGGGGFGGGGASGRW